MKLFAGWLLRFLLQHLLEALEAETPHILAKIRELSTTIARSLK